RNHRLSHEVRDWLVQDFGAGLAHRPHEITPGKYAPDLFVVFHNDDAANAMLREQLCDIEQRLVFGSGEDTATLPLQNCGNVHLVSSIACDMVRDLIDDVAAISSRLSMCPQASHEVSVHTRPYSSN